MVRSDDHFVEGAGKIRKKRTETGMRGAKRITEPERGQHIGRSIQRNEHGAKEKQRKRTARKRGVVHDGYVTKPLADGRKG